MYKEPSAVREIHEISEKHYEETKDLSSEERIRRINEGGKEAMKIIEKSGQKHGTKGQGQAPCPFTVK